MRYDCRRSSERISILVHILRQAIWKYEDVKTKTISPKILKYFSEELYYK